MFSKNILVVSGGGEELTLTIVWESELNRTQLPPSFRGEKEC